MNEDPEPELASQQEWSDGLDAHPTAAAIFATVSGQDRYAVLYRVRGAQRADTRAWRIAQLERGETPH